MACELSLIRGTTYFRAESLGEGAYGSVQTVYDEDGGSFALKKFMEQEEIESEEEFSDPDDEIYSDEEDYFDSDDEDDERAQPGIDLGSLREISTLRSLSQIRESDKGKGEEHPGVMKLHDVCIIDNSLALVMPKMSCNLCKAIEGKALTAKQKIGVAHGLLSAVAFLHANDFIHRDIKTENVLLDGDMRPVLADFSLTKIFNTELLDTTHTATVGTPTYTAPEVVEQTGYGFPSDVWSCGVVLLELFNGPINAEKDRVALKKIEELTTKMTNKPLPALLKALLEKDKDQRISCADALELEIFGKFQKQRFEKTIPALVSCPDGYYEEEKGKKKSQKKALKKSELRLELERLYTSYGFENPLTIYAAEQFALKTKEKPEPCIILASKINEEILIDLWETKRERDFSISRYVAAEKRIFQAMDFNLFVRGEEDKGKENKWKG
mmetsp:Transcript_9283/g.14087  ORF Transcript_9283/g.14087 Transcript_9283/m.14087 type:complete len:441 (-) Transcript_9283:117-1439(-)|eukprot:CAMPEP_0201513448 /NCGR_PEP_ID=MMETSP0161_2-20130828/5499_1 /ASSEMBLY_ACC=CAM_ASM_000251 /TAXON_ID=180227 /ORGANISM="Neoparamoeba aestuarina, Strain SoJaBio B1-5/56/2" /LENGTH=440 /DNA_ID=CAMNT_0047909661 /DNA_START=38 /DNA_END=1360 /DNA_ORIENTATION=+